MGPLKEREREKLLAKLSANQQPSVHLNKTSNNHPTKYYLCQLVANERKSFQGVDRIDF